MVQEIRVRKIHGRYVNSVDVLPDTKFSRARGNGVGLRGNISAHNTDRSGVVQRNAKL